LVKPDHFKQFLGDQARIIMHTHVLGRRKFTGQMVEADDNAVVVEMDGESFELPYKNMDSARLEPVF
jgi:ribosome maturation factor RimP